MANLADIIEQHLLDLMARSADLSIQRANLASTFRCAPSQITYVLETRFTPARGYRVESRRGGGGYVRITKLDIEPESAMEFVANQMGESLSARQAEHYVLYLREKRVVSEREASLASIALQNVTHPDPRARDLMRARLFRMILLTLAEQDED
jgi:transcriptional regulator CtsR